MRAPLVIREVSFIWDLLHPGRGSRHVIPLRVGRRAGASASRCGHPATLGTYPVVVMNSAPGGGRSSPVNFNVVTGELHGDRRGFEWRTCSYDYIHIDDSVDPKLTLISLSSIIPPDLA